MPEMAKSKVAGQYTAQINRLKNVETKLTTVRGTINEYRNKKSKQEKPKGVQPDPPGDGNDDSANLSSGGDEQPPGLAGPSGRRPAIPFQRPPVPVPVPKPVPKPVPVPKPTPYSPIGTWGSKNKGVLDMSWDWNTAKGDLSAPVSIFNAKTKALMAIQELWTEIGSPTGNTTEKDLYNNYISKLTPPQNYQKIANACRNSSFNATNTDTREMYDVISEYPDAVRPWRNSEQIPALVWLQARLGDILPILGAPLENDNSASLIPGSRRDVVHKLLRKWNSEGKNPYNPNP